MKTPPIICALVIFTVAAGPASALDIELFDAGRIPMPAEQLAAFRAAADLWEDALADPITVRINVQFDAFTDGRLGTTRAQRATHSFSAVRTALAADAHTYAEASAVGLLPDSALPLIEIRGARQDDRVTMTTANAKALGLSTGLDPFYGGALPNQADGLVQFSSLEQHTFDYDPTDGVDRNKIDFVALAAREMGHVLGFGTMLDAQDLPGNDAFNLHPSVLDAWRFFENPNGGPHDITAEPRFLTAAPAEFYDRQLRHAFSRGRMVTDPMCDATGERCLGSYWRDSLPDLITPTLPLGREVELSGADIHAMDAIGYDTQPVFNPIVAEPISRLAVGWFKAPDDAPCLGCEIPDFPGGQFDDFPTPPEFAPLPRALADVDFNFGIRVGLNVGLDGLENRSGIGWVEFRSEIANREQFTYSPDVPVKGEQLLLPAVAPPETLPATIMNFYFRSDESAGAPFTFIAQLGEDGAQFDSTLGDFGGYRITGFVDSEFDGVFGDVDGVLTFLLLADAPGDPDGGQMNVYQLALGGNESGFIPDDDVGPDLGPYVPGDTWPFDGVVDLYDLNNVRNHFGETGEFGTPGDTPRFDGVVDLTDLNAVRNNFGAGANSPVPEMRSRDLALLGILMCAIAGVRFRRE